MTPFSGEPLIIILSSAVIVLAFGLVLDALHDKRGFLFVNQTKFCRCPKCRFELVYGGIYCGKPEGIERYRCPQCEFQSEWDFDSIIPIDVEDE